MPLLQTERFYLRPIGPADARFLFELDSDPEVMRFISKGVSTPLEQVENTVLPRVLSYYRADPPQGFWAAHLLGNDECFGWFHLRPDKFSPAEMELGYRLRRSAWGRGLATEGARALVQKALREWNYPKLSARTLAVNLASQRVMQKAGLKFEEEFFWSPELLPDFTEEERRGVKYSVSLTEA